MISDAQLKLISQRIGIRCVAHVYHLSNPKQMYKKRSSYTFDKVELKKERHAADLQNEVIEYLKENRGEHSFEELVEDINVNIATHSELLSFLKHNPKVTLNENKQSLSYCPTFPTITSKGNLKSFIIEKAQSHATIFPLSLSQVSDAYSGVELDIEELVAENMLYKVSDPESKDTIYYYKDPSFHLTVDEDIGDIWRSIEMPSEIVVEQSLMDAGMMTLVDHEEGHQQRKRKQKVAVRKQKSGGSGTRKQRKYVITNTHMMDELNWLGENGKVSKK